MLATSSNNPHNPCYHVIVGIKKLRDDEPHVGSSRWGMEKPGLVSRLPDPRARGWRLNWQELQMVCVRCPWGEGERCTASL